MGVKLTPEGGYIEEGGGRREVLTICENYFDRKQNVYKKMKENMVLQCNYYLLGVD